MSKRSQTLRALVTERLTAAAEEIFTLVERTIAEYEEELCRSKEENQRRQQLLEEVLSPRAGAGETGVKTEEEEEAALSLKQESEEFILIKSPCSSWEHQHFSDPDDTKPGLGESFFDAENSDEEPPIDEADQPDFYPQNELQCLETSRDKLSPGSSDITGGLDVTQRGGRPLKQCAVCGKIFGDLKRHMVVHTGEKPFSCSVCGKRFTRKGSLQSHTAVHRGDTPYRCSVCGKMFSQRGHLLTHTAMHSGEKPFSCSVCHAQFSSKAQLVRHTRVHTGVRPFSCPLCTRGFTRSEHLKRHVQTHTGVQDRALSQGNASE